MKTVKWSARFRKVGRKTHRVPLVAAAISFSGMLFASQCLVGQAAVQASSPTPATAPATTEPIQQNGYEIHHTADLGGHLVGISGSGAMYNTLVNLHSGPRVLGQTFSMHALPGTKHRLVESLTAFSTGFGGDPLNVAKLSFFKGKLYEFSGTFRRDRQYFDYDLLANPSIPSGITIPYGKVAGVNTAASLAYPQANQSPVMFNTVRRMTDTGVSILPLSKVSFRLGYSQNIFQGPSLSPGRSIGKYDSLLTEYQRNSTDDFNASITWKPLHLTSVTFEEQITHYKADSYFTLAPSMYNVQEADGTLASIGNWDQVVSPYAISACNTNSMGAGYTNANNYTIFSPPQGAGGLPIINPACDVVTSYLRSQPTRTLNPTEMLRFQSSSIRNIAMNGDIRYTIANSKLINFYENFQGLDGAIRNATFTGGGSVQRRMVSADYGITWQVAKKVSLSDQVDFSNVHQPGIVNISAGITQNTPTTAGNQTINYSGPLLAGAPYNISGNPNGTPQTGYFGQRYLTNNASISWDATSRSTFTFTYRHRSHNIFEDAASGPDATEFDITENGGILTAALRPSANWILNGSAEIAYADNAFTSVAPRQLQHYRFHTRYRIKPWAIVSGAYNDLERHNNTNNTGTPSLDGPLGHEDHSRIGSIGLSLSPSEHYSFDANYSYSDIYTTTNICYLSGAQATVPGTASLNSLGQPNLCPDTKTDWLAKDFMDAPTQYASIDFTLTPNKHVRTAVGYHISAVSGNQFFANAQQVNGSLQSAYQSPYVNFAWTVHPGWVWRAEYNYYGYGEGGSSGAPFCSQSTSPTAVVVPCNSSTLVGPTGLTEPSSGLSAPRNFHGNILTLGMHYEF